MQMLFTQQLAPPSPPIVEFIGEDLVDQFRITTWEIWHAGNGSINGVMMTESDAMVLTRVAMGESPDSFDDRVYVMWSIKIRSRLGFKNAGANGGWRAKPDRWGPPTTIKREALCIGGCQYAPVGATTGIYFPENVKSHLRGMINPTDEQLPDFYLTYLAALEIAVAPITDMPEQLRGYESFRSPTITWIDQRNRAGGMKSTLFFRGGQIWRDENSQDNVFWEAINEREHPDHLRVECPTPMSLMLHSGFGTERMKSLAQEIVRHDLKTTTYREVLSGIVRGRCPDGNIIIVSLDDFRTDRVRQNLKDMVQVFTDMDLVLVLGVIVQGNQSPDIWQYLQDLDGLGIEIASHTINHSNLPQLDRDTIDEEVVGSYRIICDHLGKCPVSLILPYGNNDRDGIVLSIAQDYAFIIGIVGGTSFTNTLPAYLGRIGPYNKRQDVTIQRLEIIFGMREAKPHPWYDRKLLRWAEILQ